MLVPPVDRNAQRSQRICVLSLGIGLAAARLGHGGTNVSVPITVPLNRKPIWRDSKEAVFIGEFWSEWQDLNLRPPRPERGEKFATTPATAARDGSRAAEAP